MNEHLDSAIHLSKDEEIKLYRELVGRCPDGYVQDILRDMQADVERAIRSDFGFISFGQYMKDAEVMRADLRKGQDDVAKLRAEVRTMESRKLAIEQELDKVRAIASKLQWLGAL